MDQYEIESALGVHGTMTYAAEFIEAQAWVLAAGMGTMRPEFHVEDELGANSKRLMRMWLDDDPWRSALVGAMCDRGLLDYGTSIRCYWRTKHGDAVLWWLMANQDEWRQW